MTKRFIFVLALCFAGCATLNDPQTRVTTARVLVDDSGIAAQGYDVVAYFEGAATLGTATFVSTHDGAIYRFASAAHKAAFDAEPTKFVPAFGGYCAFAVAKNSKVRINPKTFRIQNGRLLLFFNDDVDGKNVDTSRSWDEDAAGLLERADANWPHLNAL